MSSPYTVIVRRSRRQLQQRLRDHYTGPVWKLVGMLRDHPRWIGVVKALDTCSGFITKTNRTTRGGGATPPPIDWLPLNKDKNNGP
jgi:hypothetical protein